MNPNKILVTSGWLRSTWAICRNLARHGLEVYVGDFQDVCMTSVSKYVKGSFKYPPFQTSPEEFIESVVQFIIENEIGTYIPSHEEGFVVAKYIDKFPKGTQVPVATHEQIMNFHLKSRMSKIADENGVPTPKSQLLESEEQLKDFSEDSYPLILKDPDSNGSHGVRICRTPDQLVEAWADLGGQDLSEPLVVQEYLEGMKIYAVSLLADHGRVQATFVRRNLREKEPFGGACVRCSSVKYEAITNCAIRMAEQTAYHGIGMFEFLVEETDQPQADWRYWLMDINPRYWGTSSHAIDCGVEFPYLQYRMANGLPFEPFPDYEEGKTSRWIAGDVISFVKLSNASSDDPRDLVREYMDMDDDFLMDFKSDDPQPFVMQSLLYYLHRDKIFGN